MQNLTAKTSENIPAKKVTIKKQFLDQNSDDEEELQYCAVCQKKASFKCGQCLEKFYCTPQHQKGDWTAHKKYCVRPEEKLKELYSVLQRQKKLFFEKLSKKITTECQSILQGMVKTTKQIVEKFPSLQHEIEYGTATFCYVKCLQSGKSLNEAGEHLTNYQKQKHDFLHDISNIPSKIKSEQPKYKSTIVFVQGKLKLLSVLCNLAHLILRSATSQIELLLKHCQKFYGKDSLQVSNVYFEFANYYNFLQMYPKAIGCYLIAGKMRKQKGQSSFYNAAIMLMKMNKCHKAVKFFNRCLQMIEKNGDTNLIIDRIFLGLVYCYKKLNHFDNTVEYLQKALCVLSSKNRFRQTQEMRDIRNLLKLLSEEYKKQFNNDQILNLPKQVIPQPEPQIFPSVSNIEDFIDLQGQDTAKIKKQLEWTKSFKNETDKTKYESKVPMTNPLVEKVLFYNHFTDDKNEEVSNKNNPIDQINIDYQFMKNLKHEEVKYLNQLSRAIISNKEKSEIYEIVNGSNLLSNLTDQARKRFFELNPGLVKEKDQQYLINEEDEYQNSMNVPPPPETPPPEKKNKLGKDIKLNLETVLKNKVLYG